MKHEDVIEKVDLLDFLERLKIEGEIQGKEFVAKCPLPEHEDSTPSFSFCLEGDRKGMWQCFGCDSKGNALHLVQRILDVDRKEASKRIAEWFGFSNVVGSVSSSEIKRLLDKEDKEIMEEDIVRIPLPKLKDEKNGIIEYLMKSRKYTERKAWDIINQFNLAEAIQGSYYQNRIIIPIYDSSGSLVTYEACDISGRAEKKKLYPKGSPISKVLFNNHNVSGNYVWLVEGIWDALRIWSFGEPVVASFGAHLSKAQERLLIEKFQDLFILYDGDKAGRKAKDKVVIQLKPYLNIIEGNLRYGDPADLTKEEFREMITILKISR